MKNVVKYKDFIGSVQFSAEDEVFYGKIEGVNDLVTFEGASVSDIKSSFQEAVEDYIELCAELGKDPQKSYKGSFNVRIDPELHAKAHQKALAEGKTLNQFVSDAIAERIAKKY